MAEPSLSEKYFDRARKTEKTAYRTLTLVLSDLAGAVPPPLRGSYACAFCKTYF